MGGRVFAGYLMGGLTAAACFGGFAAALSVVVGLTPQQEALPFAERDAQVRGAMVAARATLPYFMQEARRPDAGIPFLRVATPSADDEDGFVHVWAEDCALDAEPIRCVVSDNPPGASVEIGDPIEAREDNISDWMLRDPETGRIEGAYTLRVTLTSLSPGRAEDLAARLAPLPRSPSPQAGEPLPSPAPPPTLVQPAPAER